MKNTINQLLRYVYMHIPGEILNEAFLPTSHNRTLDVLIKENVIIDHVLQQCNIYAGRTKKIKLHASYIMKIDDIETSAWLPGNYSIYKIPPDARENRAINAVLDLSYPADFTYATSLADGGMMSGKSVANSASTLLSSFTRVPMNVTPTPMLVDGHAGIVRLEPPLSMHADWILSCMLEYDKNFSNVSPNLIPQLQKMTLYATQAYIYNTLVVKLSHGRIVSGSLLEAINTVVDQYSSSEELFEASLLKFRAASVHSPELFQQYLALMF